MTIIVVQQINKTHFSCHSLIFIKLGELNNFQKLAI